MPRLISSLSVVFAQLCLSSTICLAQQAEKPIPQEKPNTEESKPNDTGKRVELNLLGKADAASGESRRNENVQFNLVDNNALKELNIRLGTTATIVSEFNPANGYFGAEFGNAPKTSITVPGRSEEHTSELQSPTNLVCR